jgi:hypothetical protein
MVVLLIWGKHKSFKDIVIRFVENHAIVEDSPTGRTGPTSTSEMEECDGDGTSKRPGRVYSCCSPDGSHWSWALL